MIATLEDVLLADIIANPDDDTPRLVYADWCEDNGRPRRAAFIRDGMKYPKDDTGPWAALSLERQLDKGREQRVYDHLHAVCPAFPYGHWKGLLRQGAACQSVAFRRGFLAEVKCTLAFWEEYGHRLCAAEPVSRVALTDRSPYHFDDGLQNGWRFHHEGDASSAAPPSCRLPAWLYEDVCGDRPIFVTEGVLLRKLSDALVATARKAARGD